MLIITLHLLVLITLEQQALHRVVSFSLSVFALVERATQLS